MENATLIALSRQVALGQQMDLVANNIANVDTPGFKADRMLFAPVLEPVGNGVRAAFVHDFAVVPDMSDGEMEHTGNPLDLAIRGPGFFEVQTDQGVRYTRGGSFQLGPDGAIVTTDGDPVLADDGFPLFTLPGEGPITVSSDGVIGTVAGPIGRLGVVQFDQPERLEKVGNNLFTGDATPQPAEGAAVLQGFIERANVKPVVEMTRMIAILRSYQSAARLIDQQDQLRRRALDVLGNVTRSA